MKDGTAELFCDAKASDFLRGFVEIKPFWTPVNGQGFVEPCHAWFALGFEQSMAWRCPLDEEDSTRARGTVTAEHPAAHHYQPTSRNYNGSKFRASWRGNDRHWDDQGDFSGVVAWVCAHDQPINGLFADRGVKIEHTYQLNTGGNTDFLNMLERSRLESKKISKTNSVTSQLDYDIGAGNVHIGPSDYVPWLTDRKWAYIRSEGRTFGDVPLNIELKLEVWDSPNSAGVVIDAVRCCKLAMDNGMSGAVKGPSAYFMKTPPKQFPDPVAHAKVEKFARPGQKKPLGRKKKAGGKKPAGK